MTRKRVFTRRECPECGAIGDVVHDRDCSRPLELAERQYVAVDALPPGLRETVERVIETWEGPTDH
jgi:hypothetical protein